MPDAQHIAPSVNVGWGMEGRQGARPPDDPHRGGQLAAAGAEATLADLCRATRQNEGKR